MNDRLRLYNQRRQMDVERTKRRRQARRKVSTAFRKQARSEACCRKCKRTTRMLEAHHIVHRSKLRGVDPEIRDSLDNCMGLCHECHMGYHGGKLKFNRRMLKVSEATFIIEHAGAEWLNKVYPEHDGRRPVRDRRRRASSPKDSSGAAEAARVYVQRRLRFEATKARQDDQSKKGDKAHKDADQDA